MQILRLFNWVALKVLCNGMFKGPVHPDNHRSPIIPRSAKINYINTDQSHQDHISGFSNLTSGLTDLISGFTQDLKRQMVKKESRTK